MTTTNYPIVLDEWQTLDYLKQGYSIARYGDGELKLCRGAAAKAQAYDPEISSRLRAILLSQNNRCLIGIPRISDTSYMPEQKQQFWAQYRHTRYLQFYDPGKVYVSAFVTRPDSAPDIGCPQYFAAIKSLWQDRDVILINGTNKAFDKDVSIFDSCRYERWTYPNQDAWDVYPELVSRCLKESKEKLFIISLGPTATVLAHDLAVCGYQALDLGHLGMFYRKITLEY